mmetsp:Transcript_9141/g.41560  ORF Transcript_9141/g.41560 Transcript_9141/m.41560 type:complete len:234 (+) Transcript_9141:1228-1929(+)
MATATSCPWTSRTTRVPAKTFTRLLMGHPGTKAAADLAAGPGWTRSSSRRRESPSRWRQTRRLHPPTGDASRSAGTPSLCLSTADRAGTVITGTASTSQSTATRPPPGTSPVKLLGACTRRGRPRVSTSRRRRIRFTPSPCGASPCTNQGWINPRRFTTRLTTSSHSARTANARLGRFVSSAWRISATTRTRAYPFSFYRATGTSWCGPSAVVGFTRTICGARARQRPVRHPR